MDLRIAVTPSGYDNIGAVIQQLDYPFEQIEETLLYDAGKLVEFDALFINCSKNCQNHAAAAAKPLLKYVADGGTIYASDYASAYVAAAFPGVIRFAGKLGAKARIAADVVDKGLRALLGERVQLTFDMGSWEQIESVGGDTEVYMEYAGRPILVSFGYGKGQVLYTCFHNHAQVSEQEARLLRYLVIKPLMARASAELFDSAWGERTELQETVGTVSVGETSPWYDYDPASGASLMIMLNWKGTAHLCLEVQSLDGSWQEEGNSPPVTITLPSAQPGLWRYRIRAQEVSARNFPFVVLIGPADQVGPSHVETLRTKSRNSTTASAGEADDGLLDSIRILGPDEVGFEIRILDE